MVALSAKIIVSSIIINAGRTPAQEPLIYLFLRKDFASLANMDANTVLHRNSANFVLQACISMKVGVTTVALDV